MMMRPSSPTTIMGLVMSQPYARYDALADLQERLVHLAHLMGHDRVDLRVVLRVAEVLEL